MPVEFRRSPHCFTCGLHAHAFHVEPGAHAVGGEFGIGFKPRDIVFTQSEHDPEIRQPLQCLAQLEEKAFAFLPAFHVRRDEFFELVDDQHGRRQIFGRGVGRRCHFAARIAIVQHWRQFIAAEIGDQRRPRQRIRLGAEF
ncbi:MAG: hypothetical protein IPK16_19855 [Anaerolineales bacterium]|nr:hypothetical protein [Anaerolineales bacterium]